VSTEAVLPDGELRSRVRQRINDGRLPMAFITLINAGFGVGQACPVCDRPVTHDKVAYEIVDPRNANRLTFHFACHVFWQCECARRVRASHAGEACRISEDVRGAVYDRTTAAGS
jgi:hypothetical protein